MGQRRRFEDVLLQQGEERLHRGVVGAGADPAHRPGQAGVRRRAWTKAWDRNWLPRSEWTTVPAGLGAGRRRCVSGVDGQLGGHPGGDGVADDPVGAGVLDRAQVELALAGGVLGDVGQPQPVRRRRR